MHLTDEEIYTKDAHDYLPVFARYQIVLDHGEGVYVYDTHGKKYIDSRLLYCCSSCCYWIDFGNYGNWYLPSSLHSILIH